MALPQLHRNRITALVAVTVFGFAGTLTAAVTAEAVGRTAAASLSPETATPTDRDGTLRHARPASDDAPKTVVVIRNESGRPLPRP
ncbi:hypothetical protein ACSNOK_17160 [Streptomyces sp. URMC 126]|uniref:hypothetical protein n=1 Tax=Streptomyces sp. URMC 126 TaxID=3423401 RepID=UPI003F1A43A6